MFSSKDLFFTPAAGGYTVSKSLRFRASASAYLNRTFGTPTNNKIWTWSGWVKIGKIATDMKLFSTSVANTPFSSFYIDGNANLSYYEYTGSNYVLTSSQVFRDPSAWYHIAIAMDTTQATSSNRTKFYVNGVQITSSGSYVPQNTNTALNSAIAAYIGQAGNSSGYYDGYLAEVNFIDGQALTPSSFGAYDTNGIWQPAAYTGSYGTNGFYLKFTDVGATSGSNTGYGKDFAGTNYWTTNNFGTTSTATTYDSMLDSPTNAAGDIGNYCTWNPVYKNATVAATDGNLSANSGATSSTHRMIFGSLGFTTASYFEITTSGGSTTMVSIVGAGQATTGTADGVYVGSFSKSFGLGYATNAASWYSTGATNANGAATNLVDGTWGFAVDPANGKAWVRNTSGSWIGGGDPAAGTLPTFTWTSDGLPWFPVMSFYNIATTFVGILNAGQRSYAFTAPSGYSALNTQNLTTPTITNGAQYMAATTYTGTGSTQAITNGGNNNAGTTFQPDFVWIKNRGAAWNNNLYDVIRGTGKALFSDLTDAEATNSIYGYLSAFSASGFSATAGTTSGNLTNQSSSTYVAWQWKAGGSSVVNNVGTIQSTVSANTTAGFSVVTYTGTGANATVGHGLGVAPSMIIVKNRTSALNWIVYTATTGAGNVLFLDATNASTANTTAFNNTSPTSSVFSVGANNNTNQSTNNLVAYCFAPVAGYSAFGSYTGNGSTDGPFVYTGFRPRFIMVKRTDTAGNNWRIWDTSRATYNAGLPVLYPNTSDAEDSVTDTYDILSNGFKLRGSGAGANASGGTFIYAAFAENPFKISRAR